MLNILRCGRAKNFESLVRIGLLSRLSSRNPRYENLLFSPMCQSVAFLHRSSCEFNDNQEKKSRWQFHVSMTEEEKRKKKEKIEEMKEEEEPKTVFGKVKYYFKRYWYIAVPAHMACSILWFGGLYAVAKCGVDVTALLRFIHAPALVIEKIENVPPSAGVLVVALLLYKVATPFRYMTTLVFIQAAFWSLRRMGKLQTAREVEFKMRTNFEMNKLKYGRKLYRYRKLGVRDVLKKNSQAQLRKEESSDSSKKEI